MKLASLLLLVLSSLPLAAERKAIFPPGSKPIGPYSPGIFAGDFLYVSGQGSRNASGSMGSTPEQSVRQCFENVKTIVTAAGLTMEHLVYLQIYLTPTVDYDVFNKVWGEYFTKNPPARATLGVYQIPGGTPVEMNAVAIRDVRMKKPIVPASYPKSMNLSPAVEAGGRIYISGFLGRDVVTGKIPDSPAAQVNLSFNRIKEVLDTAGLDFRHLVFVNPYLTKNMPARVMNEEYAKRFEFGNTPARATIEVNFLPHGANIEFTGVAVRDLSQRRAVRPKNMKPSPTASPCVFAGDTFYCSAKSGFIPGPHGGIYADTVEDQVRQTMRNLLDGLEEAGLDFSNVVASNVYLDNLEEFAKMNAVYGQYFPANAPPTRTTVSPLAPVERKRSANGQYPKLEEISIVAVR